MKQLMFLAVSAFLSGCATTSHYGNFSPVMDQYAQAGIAYDTTRALARLYPPAHTWLQFKQPINDDYGRQLVKNLRRSGYAVREYAPENKIESAGKGSSIFPLAYIIDEPSASMTRVTLLVGNDVLTRGYDIVDGMYVPAGKWTYKGATDHD
ncbi:MAG: conjugal transfer protein TrbH [Endozoicomonas sp. (ex Botrylloides leachii)]|nr:conjugal transfer protein TrbH [Endozoicomonas sp. (ex Botrylloides leachii)]